MSSVPAIEIQSGLLLRGTRPRLAEFRLAVFDMDSTLIAIECIDEIAALAGKGDEVAAITEAAMRGEITDFRESLSRRLALLAGQPEALLQRVLDERLRFNPGARELCAALKAAGLRLALVSGGFTFFTRYVAEQLGMDVVRANALEIVDRCLSGRVLMQDWGDVVDGAEKQRFLLAQCEELGCSAAQSIAVGDGANDLLMMQAAGLSVAYQAKPRVREQADVAINEGGLDRLLQVFAP
jgi:phosphoserine phosphatase